jgi:4'-phosphopantetheinyl transferase superfamily
VEYINPDLSWQTLAPEVLSDCELSQLLDYPLAVQQRLFFEFWTRKEAYIKGRGLGLSLPLKAFHVPLTETAQSVSLLHGTMASPGASSACRYTPPTSLHWPTQRSCRFCSDLCGAFNLQFCFWAVARNRGPITRLLVRGGIAHERDL